MAAKAAMPVDNRDDATKRLTSHLNSFKAPAVENGVEIEDEPQADESKLPSDPVKVLELLKEAQSLPARTRTEQKIRINKIERISKHLHAIGQMPVAVISQKHLGRLSAAQTSLANDMQVDALASRFPVIKDLVAELKAAQSELASLGESNTEVSKLGAEITRLQLELTDAQGALKSAQDSLIAAMGEAECRDATIKQLQSEIEALKPKA